MFHISLDADKLRDMHTALNRALNTWEDAPTWLVELCDNLEARTPSGWLASVEKHLDDLRRYEEADKVFQWQLQPYQRDALNAISRFAAISSGRLDTPPATDPLDTPLPCDITIGNGTIAKGCKLRTLVARMRAMDEVNRQVLEQEHVIDTLKKQVAAGELDVGMDIHSFNAWIGMIREAYRAEIKAFREKFKG